jgi:hypothetical protein
MCSGAAMSDIQGYGSMFPISNQTSEDYDLHTRDCQKNYNMTPDNDYVLGEFGGYDYKKDFVNYTNIAWINGDMDPWLPGCPLEAVNEDMPVYYVKNGAHHTDSFLMHASDETLGVNVRAI